MLLCCAENYVPLYYANHGESNRLLGCFLVFFLLISCLVILFIVLYTSGNLVNNNSHVKIQSPAEEIVKMKTQYKKMSSMVSNLIKDIDFNVYSKYDFLHIENYFTKLLSSGENLNECWKEFCKLCKNFIDFYNNDDLDSILNSKDNVFICDTIKDYIVYCILNIMREQENNAIYDKYKKKLILSVRFLKEKKFDFSVDCKNFDDNLNFIYDNLNSSEYFLYCLLPHANIINNKISVIYENENEFKNKLINNLCLVNYVRDVHLFSNEDLSNVFGFNNEDTDEDKLIMSMFIDTLSKNSKMLISNIVNMKSVISFCEYVKNFCKKYRFLIDIDSLCKEVKVVDINNYFENIKDKKSNIYHILDLFCYAFIAMDVKEITDTNDLVDYIEKFVLINGLSSLVTDAYNKFFSRQAIERNEHFINPSDYEKYTILCVRHYMEQLKEIDVILFEFSKNMKVDLDTFRCYKTSTFDIKNPLKHSNLNANMLIYDKEKGFVVKPDNLNIVNNTLKTIKYQLYKKTYILDLCRKHRDRNIDRRGFLNFMFKYTMLHVEAMNILVLFDYRQILMFILEKIKGQLKSGYGDFNIYVVKFVDHFKEINDDKSKKMNEAQGNKIEKRDGGQGNKINFSELMDVINMLLDKNNDTVISVLSGEVENNSKNKNFNILIEYYKDKDNFKEPMEELKRKFDTLNSTILSRDHIVYLDNIIGSIYYIIDSTTWKLLLNTGYSSLSGFKKMSGWFTDVTSRNSFPGAGLALKILNQIQGNNNNEVE